MNLGERFAGLDDRRKRALLYAGVVANTLFVLVLLFAVLSDRTPTQVWLFPIIWFAVGTWALVRTSPTPSNPRTKRVAGAIAVGYFAILAVVGGLVGLAGPVTTG
ncbi:MAG: CHASE2 domain-containing sensor protein, partial [Natronomonas sp.]